MHPTERGLLDAIIAHPGDDTPRLIYADWLEDEGRGDRAEFIRCMIRYPHAAPPEREELFRRARWAAAKNLAAWLEPLRPSRGWSDRFSDNWLVIDAAHGHSTGLSARFSRGFVREVRCPLQMWLDHGKEIVRRHPVERVEVTDREPRQVISRNAVLSWRWVRSALSDSVNAHCIYEPVFKRLPPGMPAMEARGWRKPDTIRHPLRSEQDFHAFRYYRTREAALDALSAACLKWAKKEAKP